jgi:lysozyme family protein|tara:strand:- start:122 stop:295 length:174 start_codon:yes stop_codon:yes gene_type:complete
MTLKAVADHNPEEIINYVNDVRQKYYESLSTFDAFGRGWSARNKSTLKAALELSKPF